MSWTSFHADWSTAEALRFAPLSPCLEAIRQAIVERCRVAEITPPALLSSSFSSMAPLRSVLAAIQDTVTALIGRFVNFNDRLGDWRGLSDISLVAPLWTEATLTRYIGAEERLPVPADILPIAPEWLAQQYRFLNALVWIRRLSQVYDATATCRYPLGGDGYGSVYYVNGDRLPASAYYDDLAARWDNNPNWDKLPVLWYVETACAFSRARDWLGDWMLYLYRGRRSFRVNYTWNAGPIAADFYAFLTTAYDGGDFNADEIGYSAADRDTVIRLFSGTATFQGMTELVSNFGSFEEKPHWPPQENKDISWAVRALSATAPNVVFKFDGPYGFAFRAP